MPTIKKINVGGVSYDIGGLTEDVKQGLLNFAEKAAYSGPDYGQEVYDELYDAFYDNTWNVTNTLSNASTSNPATKTAKGGTYTAIISANTGYTLDGATVQVTMGGANVTSAVYSNGVVNIPAVTGDVVITVVAVALTVVSISAVYTQSGTVYDTDTLDSLKADLVVTATFNDDSTAVVPNTDYTLSGTLTAGTSTITVEYSGQTTTFDVVVTTSNLFDPTTSPNVNLYANASEMIIKDGDYIATYSSTYVPITPGRVYRVAKNATNNFRIALTENVPANNVSVLYTVVNHSGISLTVDVTQSNARYLFVTYGYNLDASADESVRNSLIIEETHSLADIDDVQIGKAWNGGNNANRAVLYVPILPSTKYTLSLSSISNFEGVYWFEKASETATTLIAEEQLSSTTLTRTTTANSSFVVIQFNKTNISASDFENITLEFVRDSET